MTNENVSIPEELAQAIEQLTSTFSGIKEKVKVVMEIAKRHEIPNFLVRDLIAKSLAKRELSARSITYYLPAELKNEKRQHKNPTDEILSLETTRDKNQLEETSNIIESDDIDETHDERSENRINDAVKASMHSDQDDDDDKQAIAKQRYDYESQKSENKIRFELKQDIEKLREELKEKEGINELLKREIEESKNQSGMLATDSEEIIKQLKIENEQLRHALTKRSFETAKEMEDKQQPDKTEEIHNLTNYIKQIEEVNTERYKEIQKLNQQIDSFSRLDTVVEPQPLELDLTDNSGYLAKFFSYRGRRVWMVHDGQKIINVKLGGEIKKK